MIGLGLEEPKEAQTWPLAVMLREMLAADELYPEDQDRLRAGGFLGRHAQTLDTQLGKTGAKSKRTKTVTVHSGTMVSFDILRA